MYPDDADDDAPPPLAEMPKPKAVPAPKPAPTPPARQNRQPKPTPAPAVPQNLEAEMSLLGSMILDSSCCSVVGNRLSASGADFYFPRNATVYRAITALHNLHKPVDLVTLKTQLEATGQLSQVGGVEYLVELAEMVPSATSASYYANLVRESSDRRRAIEEADALARSLRQSTGAPLDTILNPHQQRIAELGRRHDTLGEGSLAERIQAQAEEEIAGHRRTIPLEWPELDRVTAMFMPGTITVLCGPGGSAKSLALLQMIRYCYFTLGVQTSLMEFESGDRYHGRRAIAQESGEPGIVYPHWVAEHPEEARRLIAEHATLAEGLGKLIHTAPIGEMGWRQLASWVEQRVAAGDQVIGIDPITAVGDGDARFSNPQEKQFLNRVKPLLEAHDRRVIVGTHPRKGAGRMPSVDSMALSAVWERFIDTAVWLKHPGKKRDVNVLVAGMHTAIEADRIMLVLKARNAKGIGESVAFTMQGLRLKEEGLIAKD